jgi:hypothetical protein
VDLNGRVTVAPVHAEKLEARDLAIAFVMKLYMQYGETMDVVVVELLNGMDVNGERKVIHRIGQGKSWWE